MIGIIRYFLIGLHLLNVNEESGYYYFFDTQCEFCSLDGKDESNYMQSNILWIKTLDESVIEVIYNRFKHTLLEKFPNISSELLDNLVLRQATQKNRLMALKQRDQKKYKSRSYNVFQESVPAFNIIIEKNIDSYLKDVEDFGFSGVVLVAEKGKIIHQKGYGWARPEIKLKNTVRTQFNIASVSKTFTANAIMTLVKEEKLSLESKLADVLDSIPHDKRNITIHQLLTHTSGYKRNVFRTGEKIDDFNKSLSMILKSDLAFSPGSKYNYSNAGYQLLGLIVEKMAGKYVDEYIKEINSETTNISFIHEANDSLIIASNLKLWKSEKYEKEINRNYSNLGSTGIICSAESLYNWFRKLTEEEQLFGQMSTNHFENTGYGFFIKNDTIIQSLGDENDHHTLLQYDKSKDRTIIILSNVSLHNFGVHRQLLADEIINILEHDDRPTHNYTNYLESSNLEKTKSHKSNPGVAFKTLNNYMLALLKNQESINAFYKPNEYKRKEIDSLNIKMGRVVEHVQKRQFSKVKEQIGTFFSEILIDDLQYYEEKYSKLLKIELVGTQPLPWNDPRYQSLILLSFDGKLVDFRIVWGQENIYETWIETDYPEGFPVIIDKSIDGNWIMHDFISQKTSKIFKDGQFYKSEKQYD